MPPEGMVPRREGEGSQGRECASWVGGSVEDEEEK